jgi:ubiquinone/menaquinone biosynthesis C-methylase UbiE
MPSRDRARSIGGRDTLGISGVEAAFVVADARRLPFAPQSFDIVMANHMLYEFTDVAVPIAELARVLRPGAQLLATTYSDLTRVPLIEFHRLAGCTWHRTSTRTEVELFP